MFSLDCLLSNFEFVLISIEKMIFLDLLKQQILFKLYNTYYIKINKENYVKNLLLSSLRHFYSAGGQLARLSTIVINFKRK